MYELNKHRLFSSALSAIILCSSQFFHVKNVKTKVQWKRIWKCIGKVMEKNMKMHKKLLFFCILHKYYLGHSFVPPKNNFSSHYVITYGQWHTVGKGCWFGVVHKMAHKIIFPLVYNIYITKEIIFYLLLNFVCAFLTFQRLITKKFNFWRTLMKNWTKRFF